MVRFTRKLDDSRRRKYTAEDLEKAVRLVLVDKCNIRKAAREAKIPRSTLQDHISKLKKDGNSMDVNLSKLGRKTALSAVEEKVLVNLLEIYAKCGHSFTVADVCNLVKEYLDSIPRKVEQFKNNRPGRDWATAFLKIRHPHLSSLCVVNAKSRADVCPEVLDSCVSERGEMLKAMNPASADNEDDMCNDLGSLKSIVPRGSLSETIALNRFSKNEKNKRKCRPKIGISAGKEVPLEEYEAAAGTSGSFPNSKAYTRRVFVKPPEDSHSDNELFNLVDESDFDSDFLENVCEVEVSFDEDEW